MYNWCPRRIITSGTRKELQRYNYKTVSLKRRMKSAQWMNMKIRYSILYIDICPFKLINFKNEKIITEASEKANHLQVEKKSSLRLVDISCSTVNENCLQCAVQYDSYYLHMAFEPWNVASSNWDVL